MIRLLIQVLLFSFFWSTAQYKTTHYNTSNGLPHDLCYGIIQDNKGYIWLGTDDGLVKFNGKDFKVFQIKEGLLSNYVIDVCEVNDSTFAIASWGGGMQILQKDKIIPYKNQVKSKINKIENLSKYLFAKGVGHKYHFYSKEKDDFKETIVSYYLDKTLVPTTSAVVNSTVKPQFEVVDNEIYLFNDVLFSNETIKGVYKVISPTQIELVFPFLKNEYVNDIKKIADNSFLAVTTNEVVFFSKDKIISRKTLPFKNSNIRRTSIKNNTMVLVLQENDGKAEKVVVWDIKKNTFFDVTEKELGGKQVSDVFIDKDKNIWISVYGSGVFKLSLESRFQIRSDLQNNNIYDAVTVKSKIFFLTSSKIIGIDTNRNQRDSLLYKESLWKFDDFTKDTLLLKTKESKGSSVVRQIFETNVKISSLEHLVYQDSTMLIKHGDNNILIKKGDKWYKFLFDGAIRRLVKKENKIYSCTNKGLFIYNLNTLILEKEITSQNGILNDDIRDVVIDGEKIYIATINGLSIVEKGEIKNYNENIGLLSLNINCLLLDNHGILWLGTQKGFSIFKEEVFYSFYKNAKENSSYIQKIVEDENQQIWLVGNNGSMKIDNKNAFSPVSSPILDINRTENKFYINVISYDDFEIITEYKINNSEWESLKTDLLDFTKFQYGEYQVVFRTRNTNSNWNYSKKHNITNAAPWYKQWWSYSLITLFISSLLTLILYFRFQHVKERNELLRQTIAYNENLQKELSEVRENVAQDFHDELGNKLAGITVLSGMMIEDEVFKSSVWFKQLFRINKDAQDLYFGIKDFIWSIDSKNDDLSELIFYLKDFGEELFLSSNIEFNSNVDIEKEHVKLPYYWSRQLLLLFKEAMTNTLKYSEAANCSLEVKVSRNKLKITFADNGKGFDITSLKRKNGLINMEKRALKIQGKLEINASKGTKIKFSNRIF
ncbi:two-component regulator propeller domain-containing protein [Flavobacterium sp.]|uniref:two-component regulator propeller domain-containing protein n=1 Tax=Flavobacterium sp. TaxID=239 RepID=UPI00404821FD